MGIEERIEMIKEVVIDMSFLTNKEKTLVIERLMLLDKGNFMYGIERIVKVRHEEVVDTLLQRGILENVYVLRCPSCGEFDLTGLLSEVNKERLQNILMKEGGYTEEDAYFLVGNFYGECWMCGIDVGVGDIDLSYQGFVKYLRLVI